VSRRATARRKLRRPQGALRRLFACFYSVLLQRDSCSSDALKVVSFLRSNVLLQLAQQVLVDGLIFVRLCLVRLLDQPLGQDGLEVFFLVTRLFHQVLGTDRHF